MNVRTKIILTMLIVTTLNLSCDQLTTDDIRQYFKHQGIIELIDRFVIINYVENDSVFLCTGSNLPQPYKTILLTIVPFLALAVILICLLRKKNLSGPCIICLSSILAGGVSSFLDRIIVNGFVTGFFNFGIRNLRRRILNLADISVTCGGLCLVIIHSIKERRQKRASITQYGL